MMDFRRFGYQAQNEASCHNLSYTLAVAERSFASMDRKRTAEKVIPAAFRQGIDQSSFDDMLQNGVSVQGTRLLTIKLSLTPRSVQLDDRSSKLTRMFLR